MDTNTANSNLDQENTIVSPDQTAMFAQEDLQDATTIHISHQAEEAQPVNSNPGNDFVVLPEDEAVPNSTKAKILAALAIVAVAGYAAYWVQEPVQLKADVLDAQETTQNAADPDSSATKEESQLVAEAEPVLNSVSVDVSLFGFEPAVLKVDKGTTVVWTNTSTEDQTIVGSAENGESFASPVLTSGQSFSYEFKQDGLFEYYSTYNPALKATITVGSGVVSPVLEEALNTSDNEAVTAVDTLDNNTVETLYGSAAPENGIDKNEAMLALENTVAEQSENSVSELKPAAAGSTPGKLTKTGPAETLYALVIGLTAWINRKKLIKVFQN